MSKILFLFIFLLPSCLKSQVTKSFHFNTGDFVFQDLDCGPLCNAIEKVTPAYKDKHFSHVGLVYVKNDSVFVIEAIGKDVHVTTMQVFLERQKDSLNHPKVLVQRLKPAFKYLIDQAVSYALLSIGTPYDDYFLENNGKLYCSELISESFRHANNGNVFFQSTPMTFKNPQTGKFFKAWVDYYKQLEFRIPEGEKGSNPGSIANSKRLEFVYSFY